MALSEEARSRLADVVELQPTKNRELGERWGMDSGGEVHRYLENELKAYYYRDDNSLIRATREAADLVDVDPGVEADENDVPSIIRVSELHVQVFDVLGDPDDETMSVVAVMHALRDRFTVYPDVDEVRRTVQSLRRKGVVEVVYRTVPTFRLAVERNDITVEVVG